MKKKILNLVQSFLMALIIIGAIAIGYLTIITTMTNTANAGMFSTTLDPDQRKRKDAEEKEAERLRLEERRIEALERANELEYSRQYNRYNRPVRVYLHINKRF